MERIYIKAYSFEDGPLLNVITLEMEAKIATRYTGPPRNQSIVRQQG